MHGLLLLGTNQHASSAAQDLEKGQSLVGVHAPHARATDREFTDFLHRVCASGCVSGTMVSLSGQCPFNRAPHNIGHVLMLGGFVLVRNQWGPLKHMFQHVTT
jgi:hypothetical protein